MSLPHRRRSQASLLKLNQLCALAASINRSPATLGEQRVSWKKRSLHRKEEVLATSSNGSPNKIRLSYSPSLCRHQQRDAYNGIRNAGLQACWTS
jgi:hypothetical protein